jgi:hypothetical protein
VTEPVDPSGPSVLQTRLEARTAPRDHRLRRGHVGAATFAERNRPTGTDLVERQAERAAAFEKEGRDSTSGLASFRSIRYFSGPWAGGADDLLPVSWFLLWRSNVDWVPDPVYMKREETGSGAKVFGTVKMEPFRRPERPQPRQFVHKPARMRLRPEKLASFRARPPSEE